MLAHSKLCVKHTSMGNMPTLGGLGTCPQKNWKCALSEIESESISVVTSPSKQAYTTD